MRRLLVITAATFLVLVAGGAAADSLLCAPRYCLANQQHDHV